MAGLVGGRTHGIARDATLYSVRVADCNGRSNIGYIIEGLHYVMKAVQASRRPSVINLSLSGGRGFISAAGNAAIRHVVKNNVKKVPVVVSAGDNTYEASRYWPAIPDIIVVGATRFDQANNEDRMSANSNYGPAIDILAPGHGITSASTPANINDNSHSATAVKSGTSMAAGIVSGVVAALLEEDTNRTPVQLKQKLVEMATDGVVRGPGFDDKNTPNKLLYVKAPSKRKSSMYTHQYIAFIVLGSMQYIQYNKTFYLKSS